MPTKLTIENIIESFEEEGYNLLTKEYKNQNQKLEYVCPNGHKRHTTWKNWKKGARCLICKNQSTRPSMDEIKASFESEGYTLLSKEYLNNKTKLDYICPNGHESSVTWADWNSGGCRCGYCANNIKLDYDTIISDFEAEGYSFVEGTYINNVSTLIIKCPNGHEFGTSRVKWTSGNRCPVCYKNRVNIDSVREAFKSEGYELLNTKYIDAHSKLAFICPKGHEHKISWAAWQQGQRCLYCRNDNNSISISEIRSILKNHGCKFIEGSYNSDRSFKYLCSKGHVCTASSIGSINFNGIQCAKCYGNAKLSFEFVKSQIEKEGYKVLTNKDEYRNNRTKLNLVCPNDHLYIVSWNHWAVNDMRCYKCKEKGTSLQEQELIEFIRSLGISFEVHDRYLVPPKELDIIIPDKKLAIEYCGLYWHSDLMNKDKVYHLDKLSKCNEQGYRLITIFEDEWVNNRDIVESRLKNALHINDDVVLYARKLDVKEISAHDARVFCKNNHLQGYTGSNIKLGAFTDNELVSIMTFSKPSISKGGGSGSLGVWELSRFCSKINHKVVGVASKLLSYFKNNYKWYRIFSYADKRWSDGNLYEKIGFDFVGDTPPNYWYFRSPSNVRIHRFVLRKQPDEPKDITEWELRKSQGYNRIWDCGSKKYIMNKDQWRD